ncbi:MAG TPA: hypothetical protein VGA13_02415 [Acidimicrobiales bacterium]
MPGNVVATSPHGQQKVVFTGKVHPVDDVGRAGALDYESRFPIYREVLDLAALVIVGITRTAEWTPEQHPELGELFIMERDRSS